MGLGSERKYLVDILDSTMNGFLNKGEGEENDLLKCLLTPQVKTDGESRILPRSPSSGATSTISPAGPISVK